MATRPAPQEATGTASVLLLGLWNDTRLWRAIGVFRLGALVYATLVFLVVHEQMRRPGLGWLLLAVMAVWTVVMLLRSLPPDTFIVGDLILAVVMIMGTRLVDYPDRILEGASTLPSMWAAAPVLGWAVWKGRRAGLVAAVVISLADLTEIMWRPTLQTLYNIVLLLLTGTIIGYAVEVFRAGRRELARAVSLEAAARERERLASGIHDSVLQVLAFVQRRAAELGGEAAQLGQLAGEQEIKLRALVSSGSSSDRGEEPGEGMRDLLAELNSVAGAKVTVTGPAGPVPLSAETVTATMGAVTAALDNVDKHAGPAARIWLLIEDRGDTVIVSIRDDGVGIPPGRLERAVEEGRLGISASIRGRIEAVGGTVDVMSAPGEGTEVELRMPRERFS
jgi:signal transduction histidine kinase